MSMWLAMALWWGALGGLGGGEGLLRPNHPAAGWLSGGAPVQLRFFGRAGQQARLTLRAPAGVFLELTSAGHIPSPLPGASRADQARGWSGALPRSGPYRVTLRSARASAYELRLQLR